MTFWHFAAQLLDEDKSDASRTFNADEAESFFRRVYISDPKEFEQPAWLPTQPSPATPFNEEFISIDEIQQAISNSKLWSTLSPWDQVRYTILKRCPSLAAALLDLFNACWSSGSVPAAWKVGVIRLIHKGSANKNPRNTSNFRPIALTPCIRKLFTTILKNQWLSFMLQNGYMDANIQKAFVNGIPDCAEHQLKLATTIQEASKKHHSLTICFVDLANAYGSVHHNLINFSLQHYHTPTKLINTVHGCFAHIERMDI